MGLIDPDGTLESFFDDKWKSTHFLHADYTKSFASCSAEEWHFWVSSTRSGLLSFAPLTKIKESIYGRKSIQAEVSRRGG